jgi:hypothetical protein
MNMSKAIKAEGRDVATSQLPRGVTSTKQMSEEAEKMRAGAE